MRMAEMAGSDFTDVIYGLEIIESLVMTTAGNPYEARRSWRSRLFSRPWRPWVSTETVIPQVPSPNIVKSGQRLIMHPEVAKDLRDQMIEREKHITQTPRAQPEETICQE